MTDTQSAQQSTHSAASIAVGSGVMAMIPDIPISTWFAIVGFLWSVVVWYLGRLEDRRVKARDEEINRLRSYIKGIEHGQKADGTETQAR